MRQVSLYYVCVKEGIQGKGAKNEKGKEKYQLLKDNTTYRTTSMHLCKVIPRQERKALFLQGEILEERPLPIAYV